MYCSLIFKEVCISEILQFDILYVLCVKFFNVLHDFVLYFMLCDKINLMMQTITNSNFNKCKFRFKLVVE